MFITPISAASATTDHVPTHRRRSRRLLVGFFLAGGLVMAACGSDDDTASADAPASEATADDSNATEPAAGAGIVATGSTDLGDVLVDDAGLSLYGFLPDEGGTPTCGGACADAWPPLTVPSADLPDGLDPDVFAVVEGIDGGFQLTAGGWPLYRFAGDSAAGDITGQGSGGSWFLSAPDGSLISDEAAAPAASDVADTQTSDGYGY